MTPMTKLSRLGHAKAGLGTATRGALASPLGFALRCATALGTLSALAAAAMQNPVTPQPYAPTTFSAPEINPVLLSGAAVLVVSASLIVRDRVLRNRNNKPK